MKQQLENEYEQKIVNMMGYFSEQFDNVVKPSFQNIKSVIDNKDNESEDETRSKAIIIEEFERLNNLLNGEYMSNYFKLGDVLIREEEDPAELSTASQLNEVEYHVINQFIKENVPANKVDDASSSSSNALIFYELLTIMSDLAYPQYKKSYLPDYEFITLNSGKPALKFKIRLTELVRKIYTTNETIINKACDADQNKEEFEAFLQELEQQLITGFETEQQEKIKAKLHIEVDLINKYNQLNTNLDTLNQQKDELDGKNIEKQVSELLKSLRSLIKRNHN